jgi:hypothetical protein
MSETTFAAPQYWMSFWTKAAEAQLAHAGVAAGEVAKLEGKTLESAGTAVDEMAKMGKETLAYTAELSSEWRKMWLDAAKKGFAFGA